MSSTQMRDEQSTPIPSAAMVDLKLEVVIIPVSDVDRAKRFYASLEPSGMPRFRSKGTLERVQA